MAEFDPANAYRRHAARVLGFLRASRAPSPEDVLGEVFLQATRDARRFRGTTEIDERRWLMTIARNRLIDARRAQSRRPAESTDPSSATLEGRVPDEVDPLDPELVAALGALTEDQREVIVLRFVTDMAPDAVASVTGRTTNAVHQIQHRALAALRRQLSSVDP